MGRGFSHDISPAIPSGLEAPRRSFSASCLAADVLDFQLSHKLFSLCGFRFLAAPQAAPIAPRNSQMQSEQI